MRMLDTLKLSWGRALELDPGSFVARVELAKLYLTVPGMLGGSVSKAKELEAAVRNSQPETARVIRAYLAGEAKKWAEMEEELLALHPSKDPVVRAEIRGITTQLAQAFYKDGKDMAKAKSLYEALSRSQPTHASGYYGVGRVHLAMGQPDQAVRNLEHARTLAGADDYPIDQRLGDAFLAKGDQPKAKAAYERYIANKRANPANAEEARSSLAKLR
jgi:tetratricopeptide (TPR) repeat protein